MANRTPTKGIKAGDVVRPTVEARETLGIPWRTARVVAVKKNTVDGKTARTLVLVEGSTSQRPNVIGAIFRDALHETWLEKVNNRLDELAAHVGVA